MMRFIRLTGEICEAETPTELLMKIKNDISCELSGARDASIDDFIHHLRHYHRIEITSRDPSDILEQLLDQGYLLRIN